VVLVLRCRGNKVFQKTLLAARRVTATDSRMSPDLPRGTGKSIGGDLDIDDEGSEQY
jgi:hypothetical protein